MIHEQKYGIAPGDIDDFPFDFSKPLMARGNLTLTDVEFFVSPEGPQIESSNYTATAAVVRLSGFVQGLTYRITCRGIAGTLVLNRSTTVKCIPR